MYHIKDAGIIPTNVEFTSDLLSQIKRLTDQALNEFTLSTCYLFRCAEVHSRYERLCNHLKSFTHQCVLFCLFVFVLA